MNSVVHFEIPFINKKRAVKFYSALFGWKMQDLGESGYVLVYAAKKDKKVSIGINGGLYKRSNRAKTPFLVIGVASVEAMLKKIAKAGGKVVTPRQPIPMGSYARFRDPEGNVLAIADDKKME